MGLLDLFFGKKIEEEKRKVAEEAREDTLRTIEESRRTTDEAARRAREETIRDMEARQEAAEEAARQALFNRSRDNLSTLSNLSKGSQVNFAIPYFDVFDPRFLDQGVPVAVHGTIVYCIEDLDLFHQVNKNESYSDETFKNKLKSMVAKFVKGVVSNAPSDAQIPVVQLERRIMEISDLVQQYVTPKVEKIFAITIRSLDVTSIIIDKESRAYRELKAITAELESKRTIAQHDMSLEDQKERMRLQREGIQQQIKEGRYRPTGMQQPMMGGMHPPMMGGMPPTPPPPTMRQFHVFVNGQQAGPFDGNTLRQMAQQGTLNAQTQVWTQGMPQWAQAGSVPELAQLFALQMPEATPPPPMGGSTPPPIGNGSSLPNPTL